MRNGSAGARARPRAPPGPRPKPARGRAYIETKLRGARGVSGVARDVADVIERAAIRFARRIDPWQRQRCDATGREERKQKTGVGEFRWPKCQNGQRRERHNVNDWHAAKPQSTRQVRGGHQGGAQNRRPILHHRGERAQARQREERSPHHRKAQAPRDPEKQRRESGNVKARQHEHVIHAGFLVGFGAIVLDETFVAEQHGARDRGATGLTG
jgi:hypothetical protein